MCADSGKAYFAEGISSRIVQYMLCANALRLATAQGLHRKPAPSWNLSQDEQCLRDRIFWALYCLDKDISCRSGRPSVGNTSLILRVDLTRFQTIDDDEVNCLVPSYRPVGSLVNVVYFQVMIRLSQLSSLALKKLSNARAFRQTPQEWVTAVTDLDAKVSELQHCVQNTFGFSLPIDLSRVPNALNLEQSLSLQFLYHALVWDIHSVFAHPWSRGIQNLDRHSGFQIQARKSSAIMAATSRTAILDCRFIYLNAHCTLP